jgi:periplasmic protein TonB
MVAREAPLHVAGTHPGNDARERELFTEETNSFLVHENGGVIRLSEPVARGQLLVVANVESKHQVVAQVRRIYTPRPMNCYVELEFAEPAPRFWGTEFSAAAALLPKDAKDEEAVALMISAEAAAEDTGEPPPAPTPQQVQAFKLEVEALRERALGGAAAGKSLPIEHDPLRMQLTAAEQALLPKPSLDFSVSLPKMRPFRAKGNFTPGFRGGVLRLALLTTALLVTMVGAAWYKHWIPWKSAAKGASVSGSRTNAKKSLPSRGGEAPREHPEITNASVASDAPVTLPSISSHLAESAQPSASSDAATHLSANTISPPATPAEKRAVVHPPARTASTPLAAPVVGGPTVPPKLIKSVRAVASLDDLRDFETGNVVIDAVVGTEGEVHFISVISGPPSLRAPAVRAVKQYLYEPARRDGQPVPEHVTITIRFRFES